MRNQAIRFFRKYLDIIFASDAVCIFCGKEAKTDERGMCENCAKKLIVPDDIDELKSINEYIDDICIAYAYTDAVSQGVVRLKYRNERYLARKFADMMFIKPDWQIDVATAVPMHNKKQRSRGYNQAELIANALCERLGIELCSTLLRRTKKTASQVGLSRDKRLVRQMGSVEADDNLCFGKNILLIDDVCTTGSTLNECARALKEKGASAVYISALAHGKS